MPKIERMSDREKRAAEMKRIVEAYCHMRGDIKNLTGLARRLNVPYHPFTDQLRKGTLSALLVNDMVHLFGRDFGERIQRI